MAFVNGDAPVVVSLGGDDDVVRDVTLKTGVPETCLFACCCGEGTRLEQRPTPARSSCSHCSNDCGKSHKKNSEGAHEGEKEGGSGHGLGHLLWSPE